MIDYILQNESGTIPKIIKRFTASSGETFEIAVDFRSPDISDLSDEDIYTHLNNLLSYISEVAGSSLSVIPKDQPVNGSWPIVNWENIEAAKKEVLDWWGYVYYRDEEDSDV